MTIVSSFLIMSGTIVGTTFASRPPVTRNPYTSYELSRFQQNGLTFTPLHRGSVALSEVNALQSVATILKRCHGTSENIQLLDVSVGYDGKYRHISPSVAAGDSHIINGKFKNIPCYAITINGVTSSPYNAPVNQLQIFVDATDATNGQIVWACGINTRPQQRRQQAAV